MMANRQRDLCAQGDGRPVPLPERYTLMIALWYDSQFAVSSQQHSQPPLQSRGQPAYRLYRVYDWLRLAHETGCNSALTGAVMVALSRPRHNEGGF